MRSVFSPVQTTGFTVVNLDSEAFDEKIKSENEGILVDVRTRPEHDEVRLPNSILMDIYAPDFRSKLESLDKTKEYYLYCRSGSRSYHAGLTMVQLGFENVYNLASGIISWYGEVEQG
ncbi:MAG: rhodanese-like domain-containing protein [Bacteroidetes bacterium]|nr:rhodanese-like domain-containing protein [Bacteroidota bacterium]